MTIGIYTLEIHLPAAHSLKEKRQVFRRLKDRLRSRYNVAVAETDEYQDLWQRGSVAVVSVAARREALAQLFEAVLREAESGVPGQVIERGSDFIDVAEGDPGDWLGDLP
jgi:uncharacterized protein YlxP (DUF503 family)